MPESFAADPENLVRLTVEQMHEGLQIVDRNWNYIYLNQAAARHGRRSREDLLGRKMTDCYPGIEESEMFRHLEGAMNDGRVAQIENRFTYKDGSHAWFALFFEPHARGVLIRSVDITAAKKLEEQLLHAQKMEAIGRLAGGVAHDFNNKMGIVQIYADMALTRACRKDEVLERYLGNIVKAVHGANQITKQLLAFSRKQVLDIRVTNLNDVVSNLKGGLLALLGADIRYEVELEPELGNSRVDPSQIDQVIMNLAINARDAMPKGGTLTIETANVELDTHFCATRTDVRPGPYVMLSVSDTGTGITAENKAKIFEPFFTTKEIGKGTGLGLASVFGIVKQSQGSIWVYSEVGLGTTFKIYLPRVEEKNGPLRTDAGDRDESMLLGTEVILLVEDDEMLREALSVALTSKGYSVSTAASVEEAKVTFMEMKGKVDLLLTDVVLGAANGRDLARELSALNARLKIAFMSGYTENSIVHHGILDEGAILIQKPVSIYKLQSSVRKILDGTLKKGIV